MRDTLERETVSSSALLQAADVVTEAVRAAVLAALHAGQVCGCHQCRTGAVHTYAWAVGMLALDADDER